MILPNGRILKQRAFAQNNWFIPGFIELAVKNIVELNFYKKINWLNGPIIITWMIISALKILVL